MPISTFYPWQRRWLAVSPATDAVLLPYEIDRAGYVSLHRWSRGQQSEWLGYSLDELTERHRCVVLLTALRSQLLAYLADQHYKHGIYLVGWHFGQHDRKPAGLPDLPDLAGQLTQQAAATAPGYAIRACMLDIRLPADAKRQSGATQW